MRNIVLLIIVCCIGCGDPKVKKAEEIAPLRVAVAGMVTHFDNIGTETRRTFRAAVTALETNLRLYKHKLTEPEIVKLELAIANARAWHDAMEFSKDPSNKYLEPTKAVLVEVEKMLNP